MFSQSSDTSHTLEQINDNLIVGQLQFVNDEIMLIIIVNLINIYPHNIESVVEFYCF